MPKILFLNAPYTKNIYGDTNVKVGALSHPSLTLATLAGCLVAKHEVKIADLNLAANPHKALFDEIRDFKPDIVASSANTPDYIAVRNIMRRIKEEYPSIRTIIGGAHVTSLPEDVGEDGCFDILVIGEGDAVVDELFTTSSLQDLPGIMYRDGASGKMVRTVKRKLISDLNNLPYPAWQLFKTQKYKNSRLLSRRNPAGLMETSRGCAFQCNFCNKLIFGSEYRAKAPGRVVDEMEYMLKSGFREIHIIDDSFTQDINRAKEICIEIIRRNLKFPWSSLSGIRVDMADFEFFRLAKKAGCWQLAFGIESGDQDVLDRINKKTSLSQIETAVKFAQKAGIDTFGFFVLGLSGEDEESLKRTIEFAKKLPLDIAKFNICIPYPGTSYYKELKSENRIISENWPKYICHQTDEPLFIHPNLSWATISAYHKAAFRKFYLRPSYIARRLIRSLKMGDLIYDAQYFLNSRW